MNEEPTSHEKGLALELKLYELFKSKGYQVIHSTKRVGKSGAEHEIDVLAEYRCPLHTSQVVIEAKSYDSPINKDRIMKLIQIVDDLGVDRGIIVTTSYFTPGAIKTAEGHNVELWGRERLTRLMGEMEITALEKGLPEKVKVLERTVKPSLGMNEARRIIQDIMNEKASGGFLGKGKIIEQLEAVSMVYYPYYEAEVEATVTEVQKTGWRSKQAVKKIVTKKVSVDAVIGCPVTLDENGVSYPYTYLGLLNEDEINVLRTAKGSKKGYYSKDLPKGLGYSPYTATKILSGLAAKGVIAVERGFFQVKVSYPHDLRQLTSISSVHTTQEGVEAEARSQGPTKDASAVIKALESYWTGTTVKNLITIYYPYFVYVLVAEDGSKRIEVLDAITGKINETLGKLLKWRIVSH